METAKPHPEHTSVLSTDVGDTAWLPARLDVWDSAVRVFHWALVALVTTSWLTGGTGERLHEVVGYAIAGLIAFRLVWGFVGTHHARFSDFVPTPGRVARYLVGMARRRPSHHAGHNPMGALMIVLLLGVLTTLVVTGTMMQTNRFFGVEWVEELHATAANGLLLMVPLHMAGALLSSWMHRENLIASMFSGKKPALEGQAPPSPLAHLEFRLRGMQGLLALSLLVAAGAFYGWISTSGRGSSGPGGTSETAQPAPPTETAAQTVLVAAAAPEAAFSPASPAREAAPMDLQGFITPSPSWVLASGGRLYDNWYAALGQAGPSTRHPAWPEENPNLKAADTWRCASCHGFDYRGRPGPSQALASVKRIRGIERMRDKPVDEIVSILENRTHRYTDELMPAQAKRRLAAFVSQGQHDVLQHIAEDGRPRGDAAAGRNLFQSLCATCHGRASQTLKLTGLNKSDPTGPPIDLVSKAHSNPAEVLHKVRNGHPGMSQRSLRGLDMQASVDVLAYIRQFP